ncbi:hypothetical protein NM534_004319 [Enterobacter hormaechei]|nr:hypothetical protein [Enterobacter hormaechei]
MADAAFTLPKGVYQKHKQFFEKLKMDIEVHTSDKNMDMVSMSCLKDGDIQDFWDLVEATRLTICRQENLTADTGGAGVVWIFHH